MKKHAPIVLAAALPIIFICILALSILIPASKIKPAHDFVYTASSEYNEYYDPTYSGIVSFENRYELREGILEMIPVPLESIDARVPVRYETAPKLFYYNVRENTTREISFEDASQLQLTPGPSSPDGYVLRYEYGNNGILGIFGSGSSSGHVISRGAAHKRLEGFSATDHYVDPYNFKLIGWVN